MSRVGRARRVLGALALTLPACGAGNVEPSPSLDAWTPPADAAPPGEARIDMAPVARVWFVRSRDPAGGDGSRERPFGEPEAAYAVARPGDIVLLLPGEHPTPALPPDGVELAGSGVEVTTVDGPLVVDRPVVLGGMTVRGGDPPLRVTAEGRATIDGLTVADAPGAAIRVEGTLEGRDVRATGAPAVVVEATAGVELRAGSLRGVAAPAVVCRGRLRLDTVGLAADVEGVLLESGEAVIETALVDGVTTGLHVAAGRAVVRGGRIANARDPRGTGTGVRVAGGQAEVQDLTVAECDRGFRVDPQGALTVRASLVDDPATDGLSVQGGAATVDGLLVTGPGNVGAAVLDGGTLNATALEVVEPARVGVLADGARLTARNLVIRDAAVRGMTLSGAIADIEGMLVVGAGDVGVQITDPVERVAVRDGRVEGCGTTGISVFGVGGRVELERVTVRGTTPGTGGLAEGIHVFRGDAHLVDVLSVENTGSGVLFERSTGTMTGGIASRNGEPGVIVLEPGAPVVVDGVTLEANTGAGALTLVGELRVTDSVAVDNVASPTSGPGHGLAASAGGRLVVEGGIAARNAGSGVAFEPATTGAVSGAQLTDNAGYGLSVSCGANVEEPAPNAFSGNGRGDRSLCPR